MKAATSALVLTILALLSPAMAAAQNPSEYGKPRIFVADMDGKNVRLLVEIPEMASHGSPHWSSDGKLILVSATPEARRFHLCKTYVCAIGGPFSGNVGDLGHGTAARFSPDMNRIAFHVHPANPDGLEAGIWIMKDDGSERKRLCDGVRPRWSPDGKSVLFINQQPGAYAIEMIQADGTGRRQIVKQTYPSIAAADFSPDGNDVCYIAFPQQAYDGVLCRAQLSGEKESKILYQGRLGWSPAWSPDGKQILFWLMDDAANRHLAVIDADGKGPPKKLASQEGTRFNSDAEWSPDGQRIIFASDREPAEK